MPSGRYVEADFGGEEAGVCATNGVASVAKKNSEVVARACRRNGEGKCAVMG